MAKVSAAQLSLLQEMRGQEVTLHSHLVEGNAPALWSRRSAWVQDYRRYTQGPGMRSVLISTVDALLRLGLIEEEQRYKSSTSEQGAYAWETWTINYRLTEQGHGVVAVASTEAAISRGG